MSGARVIYKPRSVDGEGAFFALIGRLNALGEGPSLRTLSIVARDGYGWCEHVSPVACATQAGLSLYFQRAGMLLAVLHLLAVTDIHCENVIAAGEHPVVVDLETLLNGWTALGEPWSVLNTGFLPRWQAAPGGERFDLSGLAADETHRAGIERRCWVNVNTDQMYWGEPITAPAPMFHRASIGGQLANPHAFLSDLRAGFEQMYDGLVAHRSTLLEDTELLAQFDNLTLRVLIRGTITYSELQLRLLHPEFLADGIDRSIELEWLARPLTGPNTSRERALVYEHERLAMEALDVPHFTTAFARRTLDEVDDPDLEFLSAPRNVQVLRARLRDLSAEDREEQTKLIEQSFAQRYSPAAELGPGPIGVQPA
jgi:type 2 lantibiotic biosynthesis protein LanM